MCGGKCGGCMCVPAMIGKILVIIGGVNWGLVGVGMLMGKGMDGWNVVHMILGTWPTVEAIVYILVGVAALIKIFGCKCKKCMGGCAGGTCEAPEMDKKM